MAFGKQLVTDEAEHVSTARRLIQGIIIRLLRPLILEEVAGARKISQALVEGDRRNYLWRASREQVGRSSFHPYRMRLNLRSAVDRATFFLGRWEQLETQLFMRDMLYQSDVVVDIGANRGMFTLCAAHLVGRSGLVISFEPDAASRKLLEREISINNIRNVSVRPYGAGLKEGKRARGSAMVRVVKADDHIRNLSPALLRIACRAQAHDALTGLVHTIKAGYPVILVDIGKDSNREAIAQTLGALGYEGACLKASGKGRRSHWLVSPIDPSAESYTSIWSHPATHAASRRIINSHRSAIT